MSLKVEEIKKLMGWCPNAKTLETGSRVSPANFEAYDQFGGEKTRSQKVQSQFSRLDIQLLLLPFFFIPVYINLLFRKGINIEALLVGLLLSLPIYLLGWKKQMHQYDALEKESVVLPSFKRTFFLIFLLLILGLILLMAFLPYIPSIPNAQTLYSFTAGALVLMWGFYFQLIYWEKKNHMKIYTKREKKFQKMCAIREKE